MTPYMAIFQPLNHNSEESVGFWGSKNGMNAKYVPAWVKIGIEIAKIKKIILEYLFLLAFESEMTLSSALNAISSNSVFKKKIWAIFHPKYTII